MPKTILKIAGGREVHLKENDKMALRAGANGIITGDHSTTGGNEANRGHCDDPRNWAQIIKLSSLRIVWIFFKIGDCIVALELWSLEAHC